MIAVIKEKENVMSFFRRLVIILGTCLSYIDVNVNNYSLKGLRLDGLCRRLDSLGTT